LETAGRVHPLELEVQLDAEVVADLARADERRSALAQRQRRRVRPDGEPVAEALDNAHYAQPSSATPRSDTTGNGSGLRRTSPSASIAASASLSEPSGASCVTTWSVAPPPFGCWRSLAIEISRSASCSATCASTPGRSSTERWKYH